MSQRENITHTFTQIHKTIYYSPKVFSLMKIICWRQIMSMFVQESVRVFDSVCVTCDLSHWISGESVWKNPRHNSNWWNRSKMNESSIYKINFTFMSGCYCKEELWVKIIIYKVLNFATRLYFRLLYFIPLCFTLRYSILLYFSICYSNVFNSSLF